MPDRKARLLEAVQYHRTHPDDTIQSIATKFDGKRRTISHRICKPNQHEGSQNGGNNRILSPTQEDAISIDCTIYQFDSTNIAFLVFLCVCVCVC
jgi:hypothetical protein